MPAPLMVKLTGAVRLIVYPAAAPMVNMMVFTSVSCETVTAVWLEVSNTAVADELFGTVAGFQLLPVFQSGLVPPTQVWPRAPWGRRQSAVNAAMEVARIEGRRRRADGRFFA